MSDRSIIMRTESVRAILDGHKTQTRRVMTVQPAKDFVYIGMGLSDDYKSYGAWGKEQSFDDPEWKYLAHYYKCPYGRIGDRLWVRETWADLRKYIDDIYPHQAPVAYAADDITLVGEKWRSPMFMPRWASRITLEITDIRVQRVQEISEQDAQAEGAKHITLSAIGSILDNLTTGYEPPKGYRAGFRNTWNAQNAKRGYSWDSNPWVWVISFKEANGQ